jgi:hypothetical protein
MTAFCQTPVRQVSHHDVNGGLGFPYKTKERLLSSIFEEQL